MKKLIELFLILIVVMLCSSGKKPVPGVIYFPDWQFKTGDDRDWSNPDFNDSDWKKLEAGIMWEQQGFAGYDGYAWYRKKFDLPREMLTQAFFKDTVEINLGKVDDCDETYLNGILLGKNGVLAIPSDKTKFEVDLKSDNYSKDRVYRISAKDKRLFWGKINTIAVRVFDHGGDGGFSVAKMYLTVRDIKDYIVINDIQSGLKLNKGKYSKTLFIKNTASFATISGKVLVSVDDVSTGKILLKKDWNVIMKPNSIDSLSFTFDDQKEVSLEGEYTFIESKGEHLLTQSQTYPFILTPKSPETPLIHGAKIMGVRPGSPFLFRIPATGIRPMTFSVENLPEGLSLNNSTGIITGNISKAGEYKVVLGATNSTGNVTRDFKIVVGDKLALTPPMGWNSWNVWGLAVDNDKVKAAADVFISSGLADHGYTYINIDDGWEAQARAANGEIVTNEKFPDIKATSDYVHTKGLRFGIYSSPGPKTCGGYLGSYRYELQDAQTYSNWGIDYLKYDWCSYSEVCKNVQSLQDQQKPYVLINECLKKQPRDIVLSMCQYGMADVWKWGGSIGGQLWRTTGDIVDTWESLKGIGFYQSVPAPYAKPGNWNDPDMLVVGNVGWGPNLHATRLTVSEQYTHISLWAMLSAPLLMGCDLTKLDAFTINLLTNDEVIDIDQDALGKSAVPVIKNPLYEVWVKELEDGSKVIGLFNLENIERKISIDWEKVGISGKQLVRDVWQQKNIGSFDKSFESTVLPHGVILINVSGESN